jgi:hypothetical protein
MWGEMRGVMMVLASEVTPGLQQEQSLTPISLCHEQFNGAIEWIETQEDIALTQKTGLGM